MRALHRLLVLYLVRTLGLRRVWLVPAGFLAWGYLFATQSNFKYVRDHYGGINTWDVVATAFASPICDMWLFVFAFGLLLADSLRIDHQEGFWAVVLTRSPSRATCWLAKIASIAALAMLYVLIAMLALTVAAALAGVPLGLADSPASRAGVPIAESYAWYPRDFSLPVAAFVPLIALYKAAILWMLGSIMLAASLPAGNLVASLAVPIGWVAFSAGADAGGRGGRSPYWLLYDVRVFTSYHKHFWQGATVSLAIFLAIVLGLIGVAGLVGVARIRRAEL